MAKIFMRIIFFTILILIFSFQDGLCSTTLASINKSISINNDTIPGNINDSVNNTDTEKTDYNIKAFADTVLKNIVYTSAVNYKGVQLLLALDVYKPADAGDKKLPAVILIHGGSFRGGDKNNLYSTCSKIADNGYVVISVNYRVGWGFISRNNAKCSDSVLLKNAIYRAVQDTHSAIRFIAGHAAEYNIDKNWVFLGGQSAGAITALATAYLKEKDVAAFFPGYTKEFGPLDTVINSSDSVLKLKGVISMWGAFANPNLITAETALPTIFFQGALDKGVPFDARAFVPCDSATIFYGTYPLYNRLKTLGETVIAHVDPQGGHGVFEEDFRVNNILCFLNDVRQGIKKQLYLTGIQNSCDKQ